MGDVVMPGLSGNLISEVYVDGVPLSAISEGDTEPFPQWATPARFWSSTPRLGFDTTREVISLATSVARLTNRIQFQVSNFPCRVFAQYLDDRRVWRDIMEPNGSRPVSMTVERSVPQVVTAVLSTSGQIHPQHRGAGHWRSVDFATQPFEAKEVRLVLVRLNNGAVPVSPLGEAVAYSLAVRDFHIGYQVRDRSDLPRGRMSIEVDEAQALASSKDILGSTVAFHGREHAASDIYWREAQASAGIPVDQRFAKGAVWRSEPQPYSYCVVPFYADLRNAQGQAQVIDAIDLDPLTSGAAMNLYYSNDPKDYSRDYAAAEQNLRAPAVQASPTLSPYRTHLAFTPDDILRIDNNVVQWLSNDPWWIGLNFTKPTMNDLFLEPEDGYVFRAPGVSVAWVGGTIEVVVGDTARNFDGEGDNIALTIAYRPGTDGGIVRIESASESASESSTSPLTAEGHWLVLGDGQASFNLRRLVVKQEPYSEDVDFLANPRPYLMDTPGIGVHHSDHLTNNAILRISPEFRTRDDIFGIKGGSSPERFSELSWTPIPRDYQAHKGIVRFNAIKAKFFKMEFTNLSPQPYVPLANTSRKALLFPIEEVRRAGLRTAAGGQEVAPGGLGAAVNKNLAAGGNFADQAGIRQRSEYSGYTPTEALYSTDPTSQERLQNLSNLFGMEPWHQGDTAPRFATVGPHRYRVIEVEQRSKVAYYVGLRSVRFFRSNPSTRSDTEAYFYRFYDDEGIEALPGMSGWEPDDRSGIRSPSTTTGSISPILASARNVSGVQFATVQSPPRQRLPNPDFGLRRLFGWAPYGEGIRLAHENSTEAAIGSLVRVDRAGGDPGVTFATWDEIESGYPTWSDIEASTPAWSDITLENVVAIPTGAGGIVSTTPLVLPPQGRVHASARVYSPDALSGPLHIQIVGEDGQVLADERTSDNAGQIIEWHASYTIGEGGEPPAQYLWDDLEAMGSWNSVESLTGDWNGLVEMPVETTYVGPISVRVVQEGDEPDTWFVDDISVWEDPIVWEFSNDDGQTWFPAHDIRNNPDGILIFPEIDPEDLLGTPGTNLRWRVMGYRQDLHINALLIRPWYFSLGLGMPFREGIEHGGPNLNPYDQYPAIVDEPLFKQWSSPIPEEWFFAYRQRLLQNQIEARTLPLYLNESLVYDPEVEGDPTLNIFRYYLNDSLLYPTEGD